VATIEERVAYLEGQMSEYSHSLLQVRDGMRDLADSVRQLGDRVGHLEQRVGDLGHRLDMRIDTLDAKVSRHFVWLVGMQVTTLVAIVGALLARG
jgi:hypothetical protein